MSPLDTRQQLFVDLGLEAGLLIAPVQQAFVDLLQPHSCHRCPVIVHRLDGTAVVSSVCLCSTVRLGRRWGRARRGQSDGDLP